MRSRRVLRRDLKRRDEEDAQRLKNWIDREIADGD